MNQGTGFALDHSAGQTDTTEFDESSFASIQKRNLKLIKRGNEKVNFRNLIYHLEIFLW